MRSEAPGTVERGPSKIQWTVCEDGPRIGCQIHGREAKMIRFLELLKLFRVSIGRVIVFVMWQLSVDLEGC